ncbi:HAMP domain-containing histidine kinase [Sulfurimonas sp. SAG-AH-194-I05]|nr:HAMP domain-containing sensor histidine kinase [Sulfurimonas sp. SAG-AH-194-I05]MDF1875438.1 HAMP domain-containing histidine kinase [Sulfurimonas sp. SAG-AH-194-I05]
MFRNLQINIFLYYFITVSIFLFILYYLLSVLHLENISFIFIVILGFVSYSGILISKIAIEPLIEYTQNIQDLSKETLHELNLPISTIKTNSQMIKKTLNDEKNTKRLARIDTACEMLQQRYNELEYMIKTQTFQEINEAFDIKELVKSRIDFLQSLYPHAHFNVRLEKTLIITDKIGLAKVIDNIIENAVKYSKGNNTIDIKLHSYILSIKDYGCGMDELELLRIFNNYYQSNNNMRGFGIGLSLVKRFCDRQGIKLSFQSQLNVGTTVLLQFNKDKM